MRRDSYDRGEAVQVGGLLYIYLILDILCFLLYHSREWYNAEVRIEVMLLDKKSWEGGEEG